MSYDVLVVGGAGVDTIVRVPELPLPMADSVHVPPIHDYVAHTGNCVARGCHALGLATKLIDFLGEDRDGRLIEEAHRRTGLDFSHLVSPAGTRRAVNLVDDAGRRLSLYDGRDPAGLRMSPELYLPYLTRSRHVHVSIMDYARHLYDDIARLGVPCSTDLHDWDGLAGHHHDFAFRSDLVFLSTARMPETFPVVMREILARGRARVVVAMAGGDGAYVLTADAGSGDPLHVPAAAPPRPVADTNGAGDAFVSAFLRAQLAGHPPLDAARAGTIAGAYACTEPGTGTALITSRELDAALAAGRG